MTVFRVIGKFKSVLSGHQKKRMVQLAIIMVIGGMMEMLSVSLMIPFINAVMYPNKVMDNTLIKSCCEVVGIESPNTFLIVAALVLALIYISKNLYLLIQTNIQLRFVYNNMFATQKTLFRNYLNRPYEYYLGVNSGEIIRVIINDTRDAFFLLTSLLGFFSELVVSAVLTITIFIISPGLTSGMAVLLIVMVSIILKILRPILKKTGLTNQKSASSMNQWLLQAIQGIKELKIMGKEVFFEDKFSESGRVYVRSTYQSQTYSLIPRFMIEAMTMGAFFIMVALMIYSGIPLNSLIPMLSAVAMAAIRLLPAANRISQSIADISYREPMLDKMIENLRNIGKSADDKLGKKTTDNPKMTGKLSDRIELFKISYQYPSGDKDVLNNASMVVKKGESVGIVGASGAGKTTAVDVMLGLLKTKNGKVLVDGTDIELDIKGWLSQVSYIPQSIFMMDGSIRQNVAFGVNDEDIDDNQVWDALREAALVEFVENLPEGLDTQLGERGIRVSGGQRQRIGIARALYTKPAVLFFDEATSALDSDTESAIMESINNLKGSKTMIIIAHRLTTIENCNKVYRVEEGKFVKQR